ncbi:hypothetical protein AB0L63_07165 [Nocardia sp. NPDC051990]|uniref:hypothetical protein n=1 Tax=Nocardia sp. NPDC051990 TaxID=3155285 RepID=UPI0034156A2B
MGVVTGPALAVHGTDRFRAGTSDTHSDSNRATSENRTGAAQSTPRRPIAEPVASTQTEPAPTRDQSDSNATVRPNSDPIAQPDRADAARQARDSDGAVRPEGDVPETDRAVRSEALDEAMAIAMQRDALLRAGAIPVTDRVGVVPGEPARVFVVGWGEATSNRRAQIFTR